MKKALFFACAALAIAAPAYKISTKIKIGGEGRWDDLYVDGANHRLYVAHNSQVEVIDTIADQLIGTIPDTPVVQRRVWRVLQQPTAGSSSISIRWTIPRA
jgi:hypothetical protein